MKTIQLQIEDDNYESFLTIIKSLKKDMVKNFLSDKMDSFLSCLSARKHIQR